MDNDKKRVRMRIYQIHDLDLMLYYESLNPSHHLGNPHVPFASMMKRLLSDYCKKEKRYNYIMRYNGIPKVTNIYQGEMRGSIYVRFTVTDPDVIEMLNGIKKRQLNSFLKNLLRRSMDMDTMPLSCYYKTEQEPSMATNNSGKEKDPKPKKKSSKTKASVKAAPDNKAESKQEKKTPVTASAKGSTPNKEVKEVHLAHPNATDVTQEEATAHDLPNLAENQNSGGKKEQTNEMKFTNQPEEASDDIKPSDSDFDFIGTLGNMMDG